MTDYIISYAHGSCGNFLTGIIERNVIRREPYTPIKKGRYNDAHLSNVDPLNYLVDLSSRKLSVSPVDNFNNTQKLLEDRPVFMDTHVYRPDIQLKKWPDVRLAVVLHKEEDIEEITINGLYKTELNADWHRMQNHHDPIHFSPMNSTFDQVKRKHPLHYSPEEIKITLNVRRALTINTGYHLIKPIDDPRVHYIQYRELVSDLDSAVSYIERVTGQPVLDKIVQEILGYQTRQTEFIKKVKEDLGL